ncbi:MAG: threonylcarbamoyl-AMP synthase [Magnetococcales bacterium]|nr:threonylcarbamoyl-AMP synthase [Magnetococcales bacterium]
MVKRAETAGADIGMAVTALSQGRVVAYPTETVYGLGVDPGNETALERLLILKGRSGRQGLIVLVAEASQLDALVQPPSALALALMERFWPGPLTLVLPARPGLSPRLTGTGDCLAVRRSPAPQVAALLAAWGRPLVSTSANPHGRPPARDSAQVLDYWPEGLAVVPGVCPPGTRPSTLVRVTGDRAELLRSGALAKEVLVAVVPGLVLRDAEER